ncbi:hypothetical protein J2S70_001082 [Trueperella bonasi]|uniref:Uncharacterized protein n=1 Tax=Trueperella bonasi TaxID=312286 RepID=A0ABT9NGK4_9ACTO|nr:hypothetical protein [Trueperella bonasi]
MNKARFKPHNVRLRRTLLVILSTAFTFVYVYGASLPPSVAVGLQDSDPPPEHIQR